MARGVNKVILVGNLGADPEVRKTGADGSGTVTSISIATSEQWTDKATNKKMERTEWHRVTLFNRMGEIAGEYLKKGSQVYIEGSIRTDKYQDKKTGEDRYSSQIIARDMQLLGGRGEGGESSGNRPSAPSSQSTGNATAQPSGMEEFDDDIPF